MKAAFHEHEHVLQAASDEGQKPFGKDSAELIGDWSNVGEQEGKQPIENWLEQPPPGYLPKAATEANKASTQP